jgi:hypothetical protein
MSLVTFSNSILAIEKAPTSEGHPRCRRVLAVLSKHLWRPIGQNIRPIGEGTGEAGDAVQEQADAVADRHAEFVTVDAGQRGHDVDRGVRDQRRVVVREKCPVVLEEIQQIGGLLEVGRHVRVVAPKVDIVEMDVDDVLDAVIELAGFFVRGRDGPCAEGNGHRRRDSKTDDTPHFPPPDHACDGSARSAPAGNLCVNCYR